MAHKYDGFARGLGFLDWRDAEVRVKKAKLWVKAHKDEWPPPHDLRMAAELHYRVTKYENAPWRVYSRALLHFWVKARDWAALSPRFRHSFPAAYYNGDQIEDYLTRHTSEYKKRELADLPMHDIELEVVARVREYVVKFGLEEKNNPHNDKAAHRTVCAIVHHCWLNWH